MPRLDSVQLNERFVTALGDLVMRSDDIHTSALTIDLVPPLPGLRVYLFNATNPPGGRPTAEHKIQLMVPGQARDQRGNFDTSADRVVIVAGYVEEHDVFVLWDGSLHRDFAFSKNVQVRTATVLAAAETGGIVTQQRQLNLGKEVVIAVPATILAEALGLRIAAHPEVPGPVGILPPPDREAGGRAYVRPHRAGAPVESPIRVFEVDPDLIDRGTIAHKDVQDALADVLRAHGIEPLSPRPGDPQFDIAWVLDFVAFITEVKSLTAANEERQLRLGLGQVLSYTHLLHWPQARIARAVLAVERRPTAEYWSTLCAEHDVLLTWPEAYEEMFDALLAP